MVSEICAVIFEQLTRALPFVKLNTNKPTFSTFFTFPTFFTEDPSNGPHQFYDTSVVRKIITSSGQPPCSIKTWSSRISKFQKNKFCGFHKENIIKGLLNIQFAYSKSSEISIRVLGFQTSMFIFFGFRGVLAEGKQKIRRLENLDYDSHWYSEKCLHL